MLLVFLVVVVVVVVVKEYREGSHIFSSSSSSSVRFHSSSSSLEKHRKGFRVSVFWIQKKKKREIFLSFFLSKNERKTRSCCPKDFDRLNTRRVARRLETFAKEKTFFFFPQVKGRALYLFSKKKKKKKKKRHIFVRREEV